MSEFLETPKPVQEPVAISSLLKDETDLIVAIKTKLEIILGNLACREIDMSKPDYSCMAEQVETNRAELVKINDYCEEIGNLLFD